MADVDDFKERFWRKEVPRKNDNRDPYQRDRARIIHSAAFRRLQGKTQVMGVGEGDFHRTRLTHSIEAAQIGEGLLHQLLKRYGTNKEILKWLPSAELLTAACYAHDIGHPPFGHGGEKALHQLMWNYGGFEGNGQTLRILTKLEKYHNLQGINPTRRLVLAVLKYPIPYGSFDSKRHELEPPKCFFDTESKVVKWAVKPFNNKECEWISTHGIQKGKPEHRTLDASIMECADDIAYAVHDLEDIVARKFVLWPAIEPRLRSCGALPLTDIRVESFRSALFDGDSTTRKKFIGKLVNLFITNIRIIKKDDFEHPLLRYRANLPPKPTELLKCLKKMTYDLVVAHAKVQQLEKRGQRIVKALFEEIVSSPEKLIPVEAWEVLDEHDTPQRRVCDYVSGMTDTYAERIYRRLFVPGFGSSRDEL